MVEKDGDEETSAQNVKQLVSKLEGLISSGYNWELSFVSLVEKKKNLVVAPKTEFQFSVRVPCLPDVVGAGSAVEGGNSP